ncbi:MAG: ABC transporter ATP-binding protein [Lachnospira sp.]|nr:ABC transporter ATP-binding protein [Lachnospira sp.]
MKNILSLSNVNYSYHTKEGETVALQDVNLNIEEGSFVAIVGPSGCGKSTLLSLVSGLAKPDKGEIYVKNKPLSQSEVRIGYMLQRDNLFEWRTVYKNVLLGLETRKELTQKKKQLVNNLLEAYGLGNFKNAKPSQLSGGMRQRAALIRTLALEPDILLLDEPFSALDYQTRLEVGDDIYKIIKEQGKTAILVTHDIAEAIAMAQKVIILTSRPGTIRDIIDINVTTLEERTPFTTRCAPEFSSYFNKIWKELSNE